MPARSGKFSFRLTGRPANLLNVKAADLFDLPESLLAFRPFFLPEAFPWEWIQQIGPALACFPFEPLARPVPPGVHIEGPVFIHPSVKLPPYAAIYGPTWIGPESEIRPGAYIRGHVIAGRGCVLGNSCEFKNCLLMDRVEVPHFNYVGDSVLGTKAHLGAGVILSNLRLDRQPVRVRLGERRFDTGLRKFGAIFGDGAEAGCNAVLQPGSILGKGSIVYPLTSFSGVLAAGETAKS
jgi:UDP-N-acetylglucosamine diphosphorylase / glucose-1-phosphate thymidylyltransferase / UDP-N-acetylgalactosamine diphosphorylase / glucosamine-1-phosphate N-acetyltransferase / galactosamine-1-phosphate N-acetyltransferase